MVVAGGIDGFSVVNEAPGSFFYALAGTDVGADWGPVVLAVGWAGNVLARGPEGWTSTETGTYQELRAVHVWAGGALVLGRAGVYLQRRTAWSDR